MKEDYLVVMTCTFHNGENGYHNPCSSSERVLAVGRLEKNCLIIQKYTQHFMKREGKCVTSSYLKLYLIDEEGRIKERNGRGKTGIKEIKIKGELVTYEEILEEARNLNFPYL